jgi:hypothetical protein
MGVVELPDVPGKKKYREGWEGAYDALVDTLRGNPQVADAIEDYATKRREAAAIQCLSDETSQEHIRTLRGKGQTMLELLCIVEASRRQEDEEGDTDGD